MDMTRVEFLSSSEEINGRAAEYWRARNPALFLGAPQKQRAWHQRQTCNPPPTSLIPTPRRARRARPPRRPLVLDIARKNSLGRIVRCSQIMGRAESDDLAGAQPVLLHPPPAPRHPSERASRAPR